MKTALFEKYRPATLDDVVGQEKAVRQVRGIMDRIGFGGQSVWISGPTGTGKTTLAEIISATIADDWCIERFDSADALDCAALDHINAMIQAFGMGRGGRAFIINEAHALNGRAIRTLLGILERLPSHVVIIFTTTKEGQEGLFEGQVDAGPLLSRCIEIKTTNQGFAKPFAERLQRIAEAEGLSAGHGADYFVKLVQEVKNNGRHALQRLANGAALAK